MRLPAVSFMAIAVSLSTAATAQDASIDVVDADVIVDSDAPQTDVASDSDATSEESGVCYSPQNAELVLSPGAEGCECNGLTDERVCVNGNMWMSCGDDGRWNAMTDGCGVGEGPEPASLCAIAVVGTRSANAFESFIFATIAAVAFARRRRRAF